MASLVKGPQIGTTGGPWSDAAPTLIRPPKSKTPYIAAGMGVLALLVAGAVVAVRSAPPIVAVAGRAGNALTAALARTHERVEIAKAEALAEQKRKEAEAKALEAQKAAAASSSPEPSSRKTNGKPGTPKKDDPHGGVSGPGF